MSTLQMLQTAGLDADLEAAILSFMEGAEADDKKKDEGKQQLLDSIDKNGLKNPGVMKLIGTLQRDKILKPGLYKELVELSKKLNGEGEAKPATTETKPTAEAKPATDGATTETPVEGAEGGVKFTEKQENKLKDRMAKEEEKLRKRLLDKEKKIRDRLAQRAEKRASRLGMKVEEATEIQVAKEFISKKREEVKAIRVEIKAKRELIKSLRPKRVKKTPEEKAAEKAAKEKAKAEAGE